MTREERTKKIWFVQMSRDFFRDIRVKELRKKGGSDALIIYLEVWCEALDTGGVLELKTTMEPAEEIALMINNDAVPMVASVMTLCQACGLITTGDGDDGNKFINFNMTEKFARNWTKEAIEKRANRQAEMIEAAEATALIETTQDQPEETEDDQKKQEKKEAAKQKKAEEKAQINELFERLWAAYIPGHKDDKKAVNAARRKELYEIGEEKCLQALDIYKKCDKVRKGYILKASKFWNYEINNILDTIRTTQQTTQKTQASIVPIQERLIRDGLYTTAGTLTTDAAEKWPAVKDHYTEEERKRIEKKLNI